MHVTTSEWLKDWSHGGIGRCFILHDPNVRQRSLDYVQCPILTINNKKSSELSNYLDSGALNVPKDEGISVIIIMQGEIAFLLGAAISKPQIRFR